ncbi:DUF2140 family protein [Macrococcus equi]|uniref:DUF2140 family protein n=1 Tax=Macrococcus equi TaxID=3395462 RepID=UPI0039BE482E
MIKIVRSPVWLCLFVLLLFLNLVFLVGFLNLMSVPPSTVKASSSTLNTNDEMILSEKTIKNYMVTLDKQTNIHFKNHFILIDSKSKFMNIDINTEIKTLPEVIAPGVLALNIKDVNIGDLPISKKKSLRIINKYGDLPQQVKLDEQNNRFIYEIGIMKINNSKLLLTKIDKHNRWHFKLKIKE